MNQQDLFEHFDVFTDACHRELKNKSAVYAPEDIVLVDVFLQAAELWVNPEAILWVLLNKQLTAIRGWLLQISDPEMVQSRFVGATNYLMLMDFVRGRRRQLYKDFRKHLEANPCVCGQSHGSDSDPSRCALRDRAMLWIRAQCKALDSGVTFAALTQREQD